MSRDRRQFMKQLGIGAGTVVGLSSVTGTAAAAGDPWYSIEGPYSGAKDSEKWCNYKLDVSMPYDGDEAWINLDMTEEEVLSDKFNEYVRDGMHLTGPMDEVIYEDDPTYGEGNYVGVKFLGYGDIDIYRLR